MTDRPDNKKENRKRIEILQDSEILAMISLDTWK